jgi:hypothetical protein
MRMIARVVCVIAFASGCKGCEKPTSDYHPYGNVAPKKIEKKVDDTFKKEADDRDKAIEKMQEGGQ